MLNTEFTTLDFKFQFKGYRSTSKDHPESAISYHESNIHKLLEKYKLNINSIHYGSWCGRKKYLSYQDIIIANKK